MRAALYRGVKRHFPFLLVLTFCIGPLQCATLERLSLDEMIAKSTSIVRAKVTGTSSGSAGALIYTHYSVQVSEYLKGSGGNAIDIAVPGGVAGAYRQEFAGAPQFSSGDEYVFFLWAGNSGLNQVIGLTQGLFAIEQGNSADPVATRTRSRELMLDKEGRPVQDQKLVMRLSELRTRISGRTGNQSKGSVR
jgi:hypothetical protein